MKFFIIKFYGEFMEKNAKVFLFPKNSCAYSEMFSVHGHQQRVHNRLAFHDSVVTYFIICFSLTARSIQRRLFT